MYFALPEAKPTPLKIRKHRFNSDSSQGDLSARILAAVNAVLFGSKELKAPFTAHCVKHRCPECWEYQSCTMTGQWL